MADTPGQPPRPEDAVPKPAPGWYDDPEQPGRRRYWDGSQWTHQFAGAGATGGPTGPAQVRWWQRGLAVIGIGVLGLLVGLGIGASGNQDAKTTTTTLARNQVQTVTTPGTGRTITKVR